MEWCWFFRDITEKKSVDQEIERQKDLLQLILGSMGDGVAVADAKGKFVLFNTSAEQLLGVGQLIPTLSSGLSTMAFFMRIRKHRFHRMKYHLPVRSEVKVSTP